MDDLERRIRRARPPGNRNDGRLSQRGRADFQRITGHLYTARMDLVAGKGRRRLELMRTRRLILAATAALIAVFLGIGSLTLLENPDEGLPVAEPESTSDPATPSPSDESVVYHDVQELAADADVVVLAEVEDTIPEDSQEVVSRVTVVEVLAGAVDESKTISIIQRLDPQDEQVKLEEIHSEQLVLFLIHSQDSDTYQLVNSPQAILGVDGAEIYPLFTDLDLSGAQNLTQLNELLKTN